MLHDRVLSRVGCEDRRDSDRVPLPVELTMFWHHDPECTLRYRVLDAGDGGFRLHSSTPMLEGMTGTIMRLLPEGVPMERSVAVAWCHRDAEGEGYEVGLRALA